MGRPLIETRPAIERGVVAIGPGPESVGVLLWAAAPGAARWQRSAWGGAAWAASDWRSVGCDVGELTQRWGASQESGILSIAEAGELDVVTIDPARELDPINTASPYYGAVRPGTPLRVVGYSPAARLLATCFIDEASYDLASARGRIRAVDGIAYLAQAQLAAGVVLPNTLRARVRAIVDAVGLAGVVPVQPDSVTIELVQNGSFEDGATGWAYVNTISPTGTPTLGIAVDGVKVLRLKSNTTAGGTVRQTLAGAVPPVPGAVYNLSAWGWRNSGNQPQLVVRGRDQAGNLVGPATTIQTVGATNVDGKPMSGTWVCPADGGGIYQLEVWCAGPEANSDSYFDAVSVTGPDPVSVLEPDPPVAPYTSTSSRPAWQVIAEAGVDALTYIWVDPAGMLRFRSWGALVDAPIAIGCKPADADPGDQWLVGLSTIETTTSGDAVRNTVRAYSAGTTWQPAATDPVSIATYGPRPFDVDRVVPDFTTWAGRVLADRSDAGLEVGVGQVRPYTVAELDALLVTQLGGPAVIRVRDDAHGEIVDLNVGMIGAQVGMTPAGWRWGYVTLVSRVEWDAVTPDPPDPPTPPPDPWHVETRTYIATSDALLALTSGGSKYGAGAATSLPVGVWQGWTYRGLVRFPAIPWTKVRAIRSATLKVMTSTQVRVGFGSSPKAEIRRITTDWSAGSASSPSSGNAVVWPGPSTTSSGAVTAALGTAQSSPRSIRVDAIARAWAPPGVGGSSAAQYGIRLGEASSSGSNTGEIWPVEQGGSARPTLELVVEVFD